MGRIKMKRISILVNLLFASLYAIATNYYVSSIAKNKSDFNLGTSFNQPWETMKKVNSMTFSPGDTVRFYGIITDQVISDPGNGLNAAPIVFIGMGNSNGRAIIKGITLSNAQHIEFKNFEAASHNIAISTINTSKKPVQFIKFQNLYLHNGIQGIAITIPTASDITFVNTIIDQMDQDGILLSDAAGDRFSFIGGSITNTGIKHPDWHTHGCYASGGTGHLFDGVIFKNNNFGWSVSIRRGGITIRNCYFFNTQGSGAISNSNEDEETGVNHYTGSQAKNQYYMIYRNLFVSNGKATAIYQGNPLNNGVDLGCNDPSNIWAIFNNTFVNTQINFISDGNPSKYYDCYLRNNAFINSTIKVGDANPNKIHVLSNNGWYNSTYINETIPQGNGITADPILDAKYNITAKAYKNSGTKEITPTRISKNMPSVLMVTNKKDPLYYLESNPDIGKNEY